jgi:hypothetical protein
MQLSSVMVCHFRGRSDNKTLQWTGPVGRFSIRSSVAGAGPAIERRSVSPALVVSKGAFPLGKGAVLVIKRFSPTIPWWRRTSSRPLGMRHSFEGTCLASH